MYKTLILTLLILASAVSAYAVQPVLQSFSARSTSSAVVVEWRSLDEADVLSFDLERAGQDGVFRAVASVTAKGSNQAYSYSDNEAFAKRDGNDNAITATRFTYRLKIVRSDKTYSYSNSTGVTHSVSGIRRTWGMIKEMFR